MSIQTIKGGMVIPPPPIGYTTTPGLSTTALTLDAADESAAFIVTAPKTGNIRKVLWGTRTVTTGATLAVRLETLDRTATPAIPSGTLWGTTTNASQVVADGDDNVLFATQLTADAAVTAGDRIAVRINNPNTSFGNLQISAFADEADAKLPYVMLNTGVSPAVSWAAIATSSPVVGFEYDDGSYAPIWGCWPTSTISTNTIGTGTTPDSVGLRFQLPFAFRASGCWLWTDSDGPFCVKLVSTAYHQVNGTGILAQTGTVENEDRRDNAASILWLPFTATYEGAANTNYRLVVEGTSATTLAVYDFSMLSLASMDAYWGGQNFHLTTAKDPTGDGDWTNYNSGTFRKFMAGLVLDGFDAGGGSGAGVPGNLLGGIHQ